MIIALFAVDQSGGMGHNGSMPWPKNKEDLKWFKENTTNQVVVMGRKTWDSTDIPKPLPNRINVVFTNNISSDITAHQITGDVCKTLTSLTKEYNDKNIFVIGGPNLLYQARSVIEKCYVTRIPNDYNCDTKLDLSLFLQDFKLVNTVNKETCMIEEYMK